MFYQRFLLKFDWYSRRIGVATMYKATELHLIQDTTPDYESTWKFLNRNVEELRKLQQDIHEKGKIVELSQDVLASAFITVSISEQ